MGMLTVRKNFVFDRELAESVSSVLKEKDKNFTQLIVSYFKAITKNPEIIDEIEEKAKERKGAFVGILDGKIGEMDTKEMSSVYHEHIS